MAQPTIPGTGVGRPQMPYGSDGSNWYAIRLDSDGKIQVAMTFLPHASDHEDGGSDEIDLAALSGLLADDQHVLDAEVLAVAAALAHKGTHVSAGSDPFLTTDLLAAVVRRLQVTGPITLLLGAVADGEYLKRDGTAVVGDTPAVGAGLYSDYIHIRDEKADNTDGGTFTLGAWRTRDLNTELDDTGEDAALAANQITLEAGTYRCLISCPAYRVDAHKARLYNITDGATILGGTSERAAAAITATNKSIIVGRFTIAAQKVLEVQHYCIASMTTSGFGWAANVGVNEVYTEVELWKEA